MHSTYLQDEVARLRKALRFVKYDKEQHDHTIEQLRLAEEKITSLLEDNKILMRQQDDTYDRIDELNEIIEELTLDLNQLGETREELHVKINESEEMRDKHCAMTHCLRTSLVSLEETNEKLRECVRGFDTATMEAGLRYALILIENELHIINGGN